MSIKDRDYYPYLDPFSGNVMPGKVVEDAVEPSAGSKYLAGWFAQSARFNEPKRPVVKMAECAHGYAFNCGTCGS